MSNEPSWEDKLQPLVDRDQFIREALVTRGVLEDTYHPEMEKCHIENAIKLQQLIQKRGFPVLTSASEKEVRLSWLIIHHSISCPDFMRECLLQMRLAVANEEYPADLMAYTEDRVAYFEGRGQLYGTSFDWTDGQLQTTAIEDLKMLDHRRSSVGLPPMDWSPTHFSHSRPPKDPVKKANEFQAWLKKVGWRP